MLKFLPTVLICAVLVLIVGAILYSLIRNRKKGKSSCGCGCSSCPMGGMCHGKKAKDPHKEDR